MINILMPIAGQAKRFVDCGYNLPKPLIQVSGLPMIKLAVQSLVKNADPNNFRFIFVVREDHIINHNIDDVLRNLFPNYKIEIASVDYLTQGTLCSCLVAREFITPDDPLIIYTPDVCFESEFDIEKHFVKTDLDGLLLTFKANSPDHSYAILDANGLVTRTAEKSVISNNALVGVYCYKSGAMFIKYADEAISEGTKTNNEFYVSPMYNLLIRDKLKIGIIRADKMHVLGTPEDLQFYESHVHRYNHITQFAICCDHSGYAFKEQLLKILSEMNINFIDFGVHSNKDSDHYDAIKPCIEYLLNSNQTIGIGICYTGQGFNIAANKVAGIRAVLVHDPFTASMGRRHNAANFFCLASRSVPVTELKEIIVAIIENSFDGGRHATRIRRIANDPLFIH